MGERKDEPVGNEVFGVGFPLREYNREFYMFYKYILIWGFVCVNYEKKKKIYGSYILI